MLRRPNFRYGHKFSYINPRTANPYDNQKIKNAPVNSVYHISECTTGSLVLSSFIPPRFRRFCLCIRSYFPSFYQRESITFCLWLPVPRVTGDNTCFLMCYLSAEKMFRALITQVHKHPPRVILIYQLYSYSTLLLSIYESDKKMWFFFNISLPT